MKYVYFKNNKQILSKFVDLLKNISNLKVFPVNSLLKNSFHFALKAT